MEIFETESYEQTVAFAEKFAKTLKFEKYELLGFHTMGFFKYEKLGIENPLNQTAPLEEEKLKIINLERREKCKNI